MMEMDDDLDDVYDDLEVAKNEGDQVLHLNYRGLHQLPQKLIQEAPDFNRVTRIYLKRNCLKTLPDDIGKLHNLVELYLHSNELVILPEGIGALHNLVSLDVSNNCLESLPPALGRLFALESLHLSNNKLTTLPKELGNLQNLTIMESMNNKIQRLPLEITNCSKLTQLRLDRNLLHWLPRQICRMSRLEELSAAGNLLLCLPMELGDMEALKCVYVDNNPYLHAVPVNVYSQELGFNSCGRENYHHPDPEVQGRLQAVQIPHTDAVEKHIYLPAEIRTMCQRETDCVPSLLELAMRAVYIHHRNDISPADIPSPLYDLLTTPVSLCQCCQQPIFTSAFPMVFEGQIRLYSLYRLTLCCSAHCVKLASLIVNLPIIYPSSSSLHMALAVVEPD